METSFNLEDFLNSVDRTATKKQYRLGINRFSRWFGKSPEQILEMRQEDLTKRPDENQIDYLNRAGRFERELVRYHSETLERIKNVNSARTYTVGITQLFRHYKMPLILDSSQKKISKTAKTTKSFPLTIEHVKRMFKVADLRERVVLSLATDLGLRISDFISLKIKDIPNLDEEPPIPIEIMTQKENIPAYGFLSGETVELLKDYRPTLKKEFNPHLFPNTNGNHISDVWLNELIQKLAINSGIQLNGKSLTFHCFRKMFLSSSIDSGIGLTAGKKLCGKSIPQSDDTYLTTVNLRDKFIQLKKYLTIQNHFSQQNDELQNLKQSIIEQSHKITALETENKLIREELEKHDKRYQEQVDFFAKFLPNAEEIKLSEENQKHLDKLMPKEIIEVKKKIKEDWNNYKP